MSMIQYVRHNLKAVIRNEDGVTAVEYGLIAALIAVAISTIVGTVGGSLTTLFTTINGKL
jgi:pilus assembly protein Flp/PilA